MKERSRLYNPPSAEITESLIIIYLRPIRILPFFYTLTDSRNLKCISIRLTWRVSVISNTGLHELAFSSLTRYSIPDFLFKYFHFMNSAHRNRIHIILVYTIKPIKLQRTRVFRAYYYLNCITNIPLICSSNICKYHCRYAHEDLLGIVTLKCHVSSVPEMTFN